MPQTSISIKSTTTAGKVTNKAITFVNSDATNEDLADFAEDLIALTSNSYGETTRIDKSNCDSEHSKSTPTLSIGTFSKQGTIYTATFTYSGDGSLFCNSDNPNIPVAFTDSTIRVFASAEVTIPNVTITLYATETDSCNAVSASFTGDF